MRIHEFQAKKLFSDYGIPVPAGAVATTPEEAQAIADDLGYPAVVKAQIHAGGRGKGGGVRRVETTEEAQAAACDILGMQLVTHQTGPEGQTVRKILVEQGCNCTKELYAGIVIDRALAAPVIMASEAGGMEIEEIAARAPEKIIKAPVSPATGFSGSHARKIAFGLGLNGDLIKQCTAMIAAMHRLFIEKNCSLIEINPLVITEENNLLALDAKVTFDDDALSRHPGLKELFDPHEQQPLELDASKHRLQYIKLDGTVGCMVNGAGLAMATMDIIKLAGAEPANFLDVGGGASTEQVESALHILVSDKNVKTVLINIFGGILRCDRVAQGIIDAAKKIDLTVDMVIRLEGTNVDEGRLLLQSSGLRFEVADSLEDAAQKVAVRAC